MDVYAILHQILNLTTQGLKEYDEHEIETEEEAKSELTKHMKNILDHKKIVMSFRCYGDKTYVRYWASREIHQI